MENLDVPYYYKEIQDLSSQFDNYDRRLSYFTSLIVDRYKWVKQLEIVLVADAHQLSTEISSAIAIEMATHDEIRKIK